MTSYTKLIEAYRAQKATYDEARAEHEATHAEIDLNPRFKRQHMKRELKRLCIEMLTRPFGIEVSAHHYNQADADAFPQMRQDTDLDRHAELVRAFETFFDWSIMSYIFYPYFYGPKQDWQNKLALEATGNRLFASFLCCSMARVMLPIKNGMEDAVNYYLDTGEFYTGGGFVLDSHNDLYLSIADELSAGVGREEVVEAEWEITLPTNHTIVQSAASALSESGLSCRDEADRIGAGSSTLAPFLGDTTPTPRG